MILKIKGLLKFFRETKLELKHIKFLTRKEVTQISVIVVIATVIVSIIFALFDVLIRFGLKILWLF
jgi:preprotein translocase SecE subunit